MAEFGVQATQLSDPQGQGASVVSPVKPLQEPNVVPSILGNIVDIFAKGVDQNQKAKAEARKNSVVQGYINEENRIADAVATGQMAADKAASLSRLNFRSYMGSYGEYAQEFESAGKALRGFSEQGEVESELKAARDTRKRDVEQAQDRGFMFIPGMSKAAEEDQIRASKTSIRNEIAFRDFAARQQEARSQGNYDKAIADAEAKQFSVKMLTEIAGDNLQAYSSFSYDLSQQVRAGKLDPVKAQALLSERFGNIQGALQSAASINPELAGPFRTLFNDMHSMAQRMVDPKNQSEDLKAQFDNIMYRTKLAMVSDPEVRSAVAVNQLMSQNPQAMLLTTGAARRALAMAAEMPANSGNAPQIAGDKEVEKAALEMLKTALPALKGKGVANKEVAELQASNTVSHILKQVGEMVGREGVGPSNLTDLAKFFSSPEYGAWVSQGKYDQKAAAAAQRTFEVVYKPAVERVVQNILKAPLQTSISEATSGLAETSVGKVINSLVGSAPTKKRSIEDVLEARFTGSGIVFVVKDNANLSDFERRALQEKSKEVRELGAAVTQTIHLGSHMAGNTNYSATWEATKHRLLPSMFSPPASETSPTQVPVKTEAQMKEAVKLTPAEQARGDALDRSEGNIRELENEIANAKSPTIKKILEEELRRLKGG